MILHSVILLSAFAYAAHGNEIKPTQTEEFADEGSSIKLSCSYSSALTLHWYRQYPGSAPQFIVLISDGSKQAQESNVDPRFRAKVTKGKENHVDLEISSASISDSALYYCALVNPGGTKIIFGTGTKLTVNSKEEKQPNIFKIEDSCLATDFTNHTAVTFEGKNVTPVRYTGQSYYSSFAFQAGNNCKEKIVCDQGSSNDFEPDEKINYMSLGLYWLRILFLKTVVFNILITFKAWMS